MIRARMVGVGRDVSQRRGAWRVVVWNRRRWDAGSSSALPPRVLRSGLATRAEAAQLARAIGERFELRARAREVRS